MMTNVMTHIESTRHKWWVDSVFGIIRYPHKNIFFAKNHNDRICRCGLLNYF